MSGTHPTGAHRLLFAVPGRQMQRVLVVANQTATSQALTAALRARAHHSPVRFHLIVPALNTRLRHWLSDTDAAVATASRRCDEALALLRFHGLWISGEIGDSVPLLAIEDALAGFHADEIVISTLPEARSHWLEHDLVEAARARFSVPVWHVTAEDEISDAA